MTEDNWKHRSANMTCETCMYRAPKIGRIEGLARCRRHAPTMSGWPAIFEGDWCGDHKLDENADLAPISEALYPRDKPGQVTMVEKNV